MPDVFSKRKRREIMQSIRDRDTSPEIMVRRLVFSLGYRYRLHVRSLPGNPDMVFSGRKKIIFIHGCFWHRHTCRKGQSIPKTRTIFWDTKLEENRRRDVQLKRKLIRLGWKVLVIWECQINAKTPTILVRKVIKFLG
jgi:DNA mismatch endonuclease, patch repair protein